jgi:hypothetical protein
LINDTTGQNYETGQDRTRQDRHNIADKNMKNTKTPSITLRFIDNLKDGTSENTFIAPISKLRQFPHLDINHKAMFKYL